MNKKVIVLGAGITGLSCAWRLSENGFDVELVEVSPEFGGLAATFKKGSFLFDYGIHGWFPSKEGNEKIIEIISNLDNIGWINVKKRTEIYLNGKYIKYPIGFKDLFLSLKPAAVVLCFLDFLKRRLSLRLGFRALSDDSFKGWIVNRFGEKLYNIYFGPYAMKVWGVSPELLASKSLLRRVTTISIWDLILKAIFRNIKSLLGHKSYPQQPRTFLYAKEGSCRVAQAIADRIRESGGKMNLRTKPLKLNLEGSNIKEVVTEGNQGQKTIATDYVISTIPLDELMKIIIPEPAESLLAFSASLKYRSMILLFLMINKDKVSDSQWIYYSEQELPFSRINEFRNISPMFSPPGKTSLCLEVTCFKNDSTWDMPDDRLYAQCLAGLESLGLVSAGEVENYHVIRLAHVYPVEEISTEEKLNAIFGHLKNIRNLYFSGRQGSFQYLNMDECVKEGFHIAGQIIKDRIGRC